VLVIGRHSGFGHAVIGRKDEAHRFGETGNDAPGYAGYPHNQGLEVSEAAERFGKIIEAGLGPPHRNRV
jgi:hypothetical protein